MSKRPKKKARVRRHSGQAAARPAVSTENKLLRAARVATALGALAVLFAVAVQLGLVPLHIGPVGIRLLQVGGAGLVIAGFVFGRGARPSRA